MLIWLVELSDKVQVFNLFRYITFRAGAAMFTSALIVFLFGPAIINSLRVRQGKGQPIRADGPQTHFKKAGTPTMGGLMILAGILGGSLLWGDLSNVYVVAVLMVTLGFGAIGFYDDYLKVTKQSDKGFSGKAASWHRIPDRGDCRVLHDEDGARFRPAWRHARQLHRVSVLQGIRDQSRLFLCALRCFCHRWGG